MRSSVTVTEALVLRPLLEYRGPLLEYRGRITESIRVSPNFPDNCIPILSVFELCDTGGGDMLAIAEQSSCFLMKGFVNKRA